MNDSRVVENPFKLRPCPFCGSDAKFKSTYNSDESMTILFDIVCSGCGIRLPHFGELRVKLWDSGIFEITKDERSKLIREWNGVNVEDEKDS